jgi:hypothetical protein
MRAFTTPDTARHFLSRHARTLGRVFVVLVAAVALLWLMVLTAADDAAAQRRGGGFSSGGSGAGFGRNTFGGNRFQGRPGRGAGTNRGMGNPGFGGGRPQRATRTPGMNRVVRDRRPGRDANRPATRRPPDRNAGRRTPDRRPGRQQATRPDRGKSSSRHLRRSSGYAEGGHLRRSSAAGGHDRRASAGGAHDRRASAGGTGHNRRISAGGEGHNRRISAGGDGHNRRISAGGDGHNRRISAGPSHQRSVSAGDGHYRRGSHDRRVSMPRVPPFTPPVPPVVIYDPPSPPPPPPAAGGGGGGSQPPRAVPPSSGQPQRVSRVFGGQPPSGEDRYVPDEIICVLRDDLTEADIDEFLADNRLERTANGRIHMGLIGVQVFRYRIADGRSVPEVVAELQNDPRGISVQPNYIYQLSDSSPREAPVTPMVRTTSGLAKPSAYSSMQYSVAKLRLRQAHQHSRGERVLIAVIDSGVDAEHPEIAGAVIAEIDVTDANDRRPDKHGTAMTGIIVSQSQLIGVAPQARVIAIRAFAPRGRPGTHGTSFHIAQAIDRAAKEGARIINLSLTGPHDPYVHKAVTEARARGIILVAAAGNAGPTSPPLYPAAYPEVIAVTATDQHDRIYQRANRGPHIVVAAPGVEVMIATPGGAYGIDNGTSVATAHISGIIALMLARNPMLDPDAVRELLVRTVRRPNQSAPQDDYGAGHADAYEAVLAAGPESGPPIATGPAPEPTPARFTPGR